MFPLTAEQYKIWHNIFLVSLSCFNIYIFNMVLFFSLSYSLGWNALLHSNLLASRRRLSTSSLFSLMCGFTSTIHSIWRCSEKLTRVLYTKWTLTSGSHNLALYVGRPTETRSFTSENTESSNVLPKISIRKLQLWQISLINKSSGCSVLTVLFLMCLFTSSWSVRLCNAHG